MITAIDIQKQNSQMLIEYANGGSFTVSFKESTELKGRGVKERYNDKTFEVTTAKLEQLKKAYTWYTNF